MRRTTGQVAAAAVTGGVLGAVGGAALGSSSGNAASGAVLGGIILAVISGWADATRKPGEPQALAARIAGSVFIAATIGWLLAWLLPDWPVWVVAVMAGVGTGLTGLRPLKVLLGLVVGAVIGFTLYLVSPDIGWPVASALTVVTYRTLAAFLWRGKEQLRV
ncbi:MAG TPA: hypothetical protein VI193_07440, partial [Acidimicrobiia bacterium]